jgi:hypothetical protein
MIAKKYLGTVDQPDPSAAAIALTFEKPRNQNLNVEATRVDGRTCVRRHAESQKDHDEATGTFVADHGVEQVGHTDSCTLCPVRVAASCKLRRQRKRLSEGTYFASCA